MAGIFNGIGSTLTGKGGAPGSQLPKGAIPLLTSDLINNLTDARNTAFTARDWETNRYYSQQNALPGMLRGLGFDVNYDGGQVRGLDFIGTHAQQGMDALARAGQASLPAQYANVGYRFDVNGNLVEDPNSQRNQSLAQYNNLIDQSQRLRDEAYGSLQGRAAQGQDVYNMTLADIQRGMGTQQEALAATRRQLQTAEAAQVGAMQQLGFRRDAAGNIVKDDGSPLSQYERMMLQQATTARTTQQAGLANIGYRTDGNGNVWFDPYSSMGQLFGQYDRMRGDAAGQTGLAQDTQEATLRRLGLTQDSQGNWVNDPAANEAMMRSLQGDFLRRAQAAMEGNAPVDPGIERSLAEEERRMRETLTRQLGTGWENTSPGIEALRNFQQRANESRYRVQQDALGLGTSQALNLQGMNLQTLQALAASNDPVLRALATEAAVQQQAQAARESNAAAASGLSAQGASTIANLAGTQSNISAQTLAGLYGLTAPALAASGQLGNLANSNIATNTQAFSNLNNMGINNLDALMRGYANVGNLGAQTGSFIDSRTRAALDFANLNAQALQTIPTTQQRLWDTANSARMKSLGALYPTLESAYGSNMGDIARVFGSLGSVAGGAAQGYGGQIMQGDQTRYNTNINNIFWQNFMKSFGDSAGSYVGSGGMGGGMMG